MSWRATGGFAHPITIIATTSAMSTATVTAITTMPTTVTASLSDFCTIMSVTVIPIEERNQYEYKRGL